MSNKYGELRWKWLSERGFNVLADKRQYAYMQSLWTSPDLVQAVFCEAKAGTGKTTLAVLAGVYEVERGSYDRIIYLRNAIPIRDQGFLPGDINEKSAPYMAPFIEALDKIQPGLYEKWSVPNPSTKEPPKAVAISSAFTRGITWDNAFIIVDEAQSYDLDELQAIYTRPTDTCKIVTTGSLRQIDNKRLKRYGPERLTPYEVYMRHFEGERVTYHKLETNYRGWFSNHADEIAETVERLT